MARARSATTLIEMLIVLAILGAATGLAVMRFSKSTTRAASGIAERIETARRQAIRTRRIVTVWLGSDTGVFAVTAIPSGAIIGGR